MPWSQVAQLRGVVAVHKDIEACPHAELKVALAHPQCLVPGEKEHFLQVNSDLLLQLRGTVMPLEGIAPQVFEAIYQRQQGEILWVTVLWMIAQLNGYWVGGTSPPLPSVFQINCGGLGGGALEGEVPPHFHCTCPPVGESQVYGPSLSPADVLDDQEWGVAYGWSTGVHEVATLFALTQSPCQKWEALGYGKATLLYQRTQHVLQAARLLPAHRRLPHPAFLSGLWWKLLSLQPLRLLAYLPGLGCLRPTEEAEPPHFTVNGFSAGSYTGAVIALAIRCLWPGSQITARLGAIAMPKSVLAALVATAESDRHNYYLVHAAEDCLCDWKPTENELDMLQRSLHITYVTDSARWMGKHKHCYWHWLQCQLPAGKISLTMLKLTHPEVAGHRPLGRNWFRPEKVQATSSFACQLQSTYKDLSRVDLDLPEGLLVGLGYAATSPDSPFDFRQAQTAAERSGVAGPHGWSLMLPTSARVAQEVYEPLIGIQYPMLRSRIGDTWQIGTTSIREDQRIATGLRFVHWCHNSPNLQARQNPNNDPTVRVYQCLEDQLAKAGSATEDILALTTTREGATNLRNYFSIADKKANAETAVKVAGATAKHCIVIHGVSTFLSGEGRHLDYDQECFTRANVAYSRATDLTILACPLNMQGMPGALQVLAALLHGVQTIYTYDSNDEPTVFGAVDLRVTQVAQATSFFQRALLPHPMWLGPLPVCLAEHHHGKVRRLRLVLATITHLTKAEITSLVEGRALPAGWDSLA